MHTLTFPDLGGIKMTMTSRRRKADIPKRRRRHYSYDESLNESAQLIADEPVEPEREIPSEDSEPVEQVEVTAPPEAPEFEE